MIGHCRMSSRSRALITATCKALAVNVLFCAQSSGNVRMLGFQQGNALEFLKYFGTLSLFHFKAMPWSDNFSSTNQKTGRGNRQKEVQCRLFTAMVYWPLLEQSCRVTLAFVYWCLFVNQHAKTTTSSSPFLLARLFSSARTMFWRHVFGHFWLGSALSAAGIHLVTRLQNKQQIQTFEGNKSRFPAASRLFPDWLKKNHYSMVLDWNFTNKKFWSFSKIFRVLPCWKPNIPTLPLDWAQKITSTAEALQVAVIKALLRLLILQWSVQLYLEKFQKYEKNEVLLPTITKDVLNKIL